MLFSKKIKQISGMNGIKSEIFTVFAPTILGIVFIQLSIFPLLAISTLLTSLLNLSVSPIHLCSHFGKPSTDR
ncbi:MAG: hypothetical protein ACRC10_09935 [Thermoguttaceae bacterium]